MQNQNEENRGPHVFKRHPDKMETLSCECFVGFCFGKIENSNILSNKSRLVERRQETQTTGTSGARSRPWEEEHGTQRAEKQGCRRQGADIQH